jgi:hypothetical protein
MVTRKVNVPFFVKSSPRFSYTFCSHSFLTEMGTDGNSATNLSTGHHGGNRGGDGVQALRYRGESTFVAIPCLHEVFDLNLYIFLTSVCPIPLFIFFAMKFPRHVLLSLFWRSLFEPDLNDPTHRVCLFTMMNLPLILSCHECRWISMKS